MTSVKTLSVIILTCAIVPAEASVQLQFDYTYDSSGFFDAGASDGAMARSTLESVGNFYTSILADDLLAINSSGRNQLTGYISQPDTGTTISLNGLDIPTDTVRIYVGSYDLGSNILGRAGPGGYSVSVSSSQTWRDNAISRGEGGGLISDVQGSTATEVAPWGGSMSIDSDTAWNLDHTQDPAGGEIDLYSVILHEIGHVLGMGTVDSWNNLISGTQFNGATAVAEHGGPVAVTEDGGHWALGTTSTVFGGYDSQDASMTPSVAWGKRKVLTALDVAGLDDIGWDLPYLPGAYGDANLDGRVDDIDATIMAANWLRTGCGLAPPGAMAISTATGLLTATIPCCWGKIGLPAWAAVRHRFPSPLVYCSSRPGWL